MESLSQLTTLATTSRQPRSIVSECPRSASARYVRAVAND